MKRFLVFALLFSIMAGNLFAQQNEKNTSLRMKPALLVIDIQNAFLPMVPEHEKEIGLYMINASIDLFRKYGFPIIRIYHTDPQNGPKPGSEEFEFPATIKISSDDARVIKTYANGFNKTELDKILSDKGCNTLFLCGLSSVGCVLATYMGAKDHDYKAFLIKDALMSHNSGFTDDIEDIFGAIDYDVVEVLLQNSVK